MQTHGYPSFAARFRQACLPAVIYTFLVGCSSVAANSSCPAFFPSPCGGATWADGIIPYTFDPGLLDETRAQMEAALKEWQNALPGTIVFRTAKLPGETHFLRFTNAAGCGGALRGQDVPQFASLDCDAGTLLHEIGHVIGFEHHQQRNDRNRYLNLADISSFQCAGDQTGGIDTVTQCRSPWSDPTGRSGGDFGVFNDRSIMLYSSFGPKGATSDCGIPPTGDRGYVKRGAAEVGGPPCEGDIPEHWGAERVSLGDRAATIELYRAQNGWAPFKSMGRDVDPLKPLDVKFATGVTISGNPALISLGSSTLRAFAKGTDAMIWQVGGSFAGWGAWESLGAPTGASEPAAVSWSQSTSRIDVVVVANKVVRRRAFHDGVWESSWDSLIGSPAGGATSAPAISSGAPDTLNVYVKGSDGQVWSREWFSSSWKVWFSLPLLPSGVSVAGTPAAVARAAADRDVVVRGSDGALYYMARQNGGWNATWTRIGLAGSSGEGRPAIASWGPSRLDVFVQAGASAPYLWHAGCVSPACASTAAWTTFVPLGGLLAGAPAASSPRTENRIDVIATMADGAALQPPSSVQGLWHKWWPWPENPCVTAADFYGVIGGSTWGFAPQEVRTWWEENSCNERSRSTVSQLCQNATSLFAIVAGSSWGGAPEIVRTAWIENNCGATPQCQAVSDIFGTSQNVTWGYAPDYVQTWWKAAQCKTAPSTTTEICRRAAARFGMSPGNLGFAPDFVQTWWQAQNCNSIKA